MVGIFLSNTFQRFQSNGSSIFQECQWQGYFQTETNLYLCVKSRTDWKKKTFILKVHLVSDLTLLWYPWDENGFSPHELHEQEDSEHYGDLNIVSMKIYKASKGLDVHWFNVSIPWTGKAEHIISVQIVHSLLKILITVLFRDSLCNNFNEGINNLTGSM